MLLRRFFISRQQRRVGVFQSWWLLCVLGCVCLILLLWFVADFEKRLIEEGAATESLRGHDWTQSGPLWTNPELYCKTGSESLLSRGAQSSAGFSLSFTSETRKRKHSGLDSLLLQKEIISAEARMKRAVLFLITVYGSVPVIIYLFPWILGHIIYSHLLKLPFFVGLDRPEHLLNHTCNFYLDTEEGVSVGVWHTLPASQWEEAAGRSPEWYRETLGDGRPVIIYLHGNVGTRAKNNRVQLVKILSAAGYHVLSLDYRGFGDSTGEPSEAGLTTDVLHLYHWVKKHSRGGPVCLWGHSLGSGVATNAAVKIQEEGSVVDAIILEAPYTRIGEVITNHRLAKMYMFLPGFESLLWHILEVNNIVFANDKNLKALTSPLLILHAEDDNVVPYHMGLKLYQISLQAKKKYNTDVQVEMISYSANLGYSHSSIYLDPNLSNVVRKFLQPLTQ